MIVISVATVSTYITDLKDSGRIQMWYIYPMVQKIYEPFDNDSKKPF